MRYEVSQAQVFYFEANKTILFEDAYPNIIYPNRGYDLWRTDPEIKKIVCNKEFGAIIFQLTKVRPIRLLFDRVVERETVDLMKSSFQGILIGALIRPDSLTFFSPETPFIVEERALLVVYGTLDSVFTYKKGDPFAKNTQNQGYTYGDRLKSDDYPLIYR